VVQTFVSAPGAISTRSSQDFDGRATYGQTFRPRARRDVDSNLARSRRPLDLWSDIRRRARRDLDANLPRFRRPLGLSQTTRIASDVGRETGNSATYGKSRSKTEGRSNA
jgi:hypothetical protein